MFSDSLLPAHLPSDWCHLPQLPAFQPLSKQSFIRMKCSSKNSISKVFSRLSDCFDKRFIKVLAYDSENTSFLLSKMQTYMSNVENGCSNIERECQMNLHLYKSKKNVIVLVLEKVSGGNVLFEQERHIILQAAKGTCLDEVNVASRQRRKSSFQKKPSCTSSKSPQVVTNTCTTQICESIIDSSNAEAIVEGNLMQLERVNVLLQKDRIDARSIGWLTLLSMTDDSVAIQSNALYNAKILLGVGIDGNDLANSLHDIVFDVLLRTEESYIYEDNVEKAFCRQLQLIAIQVLYNALHTLWSTRESGVLQEMNEEVKEELLEMLNKTSSKVELGFELKAQLASTCLELFSALREKNFKGIAYSAAQKSPRSFLRGRYYRSHSLLKFIPSKV